MMPNRYLLHRSFLATFIAAASATEDAEHAYVTKDGPWCANEGKEYT